MIINASGFIDYESRIVRVNAPPEKTRRLLIVSKPYLA
jgi:hypothetical protein